MNDGHVNSVHGLHLQFIWQIVKAKYVVWSRAQSEMVCTGIAKRCGSKQEQEIQQKKKKKSRSTLSGNISVYNLVYIDFWMRSQVKG